MLWTNEKSRDLSLRWVSDEYPEMNVMDEREIARFEFKMSFGWISYIAQGRRIRETMKPPQQGRIHRIQDGG